MIDEGRHKELIKLVAGLTAITNYQMGCSRQYIYKIVREGKLPASRLSSRMALIRKTDIEKMLEANPYHRVLPTDGYTSPSIYTGSKIVCSSLRRSLV